MAFFDRHVAANGFVNGIDVLPVLFELMDSAIDVDVRFGAPIGSLLQDLHGCEFLIVVLLGK